MLHIAKTFHLWKVSPFGSVMEKIFRIELHLRDKSWFQMKLQKCDGEKMGISSYLIHNLFEDRSCFLLTNLKVLSSCKGSLKRVIKSSSSKSFKSVVVKAGLQNSSDTWLLPFMQHFKHHTSCYSVYTHLSSALFHHRL